MKVIAALFALFAVASAGLWQLQHQLCWLLQPMHQSSALLQSPSQLPFRRCPPVLRAAPVVAAPVAVPAYRSVVSAPVAVAHASPIAYGAAPVVHAGPVAYGGAILG
ncbi:hypothetical protein Ocin01_15307 [Orchesella cincta]|uniref:Uncharacterized protein n=1 Tax=Orchesella cincta TaxID=48709 RepID=A0A1D2MEI6_ORCCI|nr:hypothetical protein Ocin01_15307 [Orchesella cincta]